MTVVDCLDDLAPEELSLKLLHLSIRLHLEVSMQTVSIDVLHNEEDLLFRLEDFKQLRDVLMV